MKTKSWSRKQFRQLAGTSALLVGALLAGIPSATAQQTNSPAKPETDKSADADTSDLNNWVEFGVGGSNVSGDKAQYQRQSGLPANNPFGGIQAFHFEEPVAKRGLFSVDGRGIFDNHDYDIKLELQHPDVGYVTAGFSQFREYYDGSGGFLPSNGSFFRLTDNLLSLDRGTAFFETGLTLPDLPVLKLRYEHDFRSGAKDSTEWGNTTLTPAGSGTKKITPSFLAIDEKTDSIAADLTHTIKSTDFGVGLRYVWQQNNDTHATLMQPGEGAASRTFFQGEQDKFHMFNAHAFTDTRINDQFEFTTGYSYTTLHSTIDDGSRVDNPAVPTTTDTRYVNLAGGSDLDQYVMNLNLMYSPGENFYIVPAFRVEKEDLTGANTDNGLTTVGGINTVGAQNAFQDNESKLNLAESLDARYMGFSNWVFYVRGEWQENRSHLSEFSGVAPLPPAILDKDWHQLSQKYSVGMNWYPERGLNFAASYYHKIDQNNFEDAIPAVPTTYPGYIQDENFVSDVATFRMTWRACSQLTLVSRYDFRYTTIDMRGGLLPLGQSGKNTTHMFGESISWTPINRLFVQVGGNYVLDTTHTPAEDLSGGEILKSQNNYWTVNTLIGLAINDKTDVQAGYTYYRSADYSDNSLFSVPYGAGSEEHIITASIGRQIRRNLHATLRYNYTSYRDQLFGGNLDYKAHTMLASLRYRF